MVKIITPGVKEFRGVCKRCGCVFSYELSDLLPAVSGDGVDCPTCGKTFLHINWELWFNSASSSYISKSNVPEGNYSNVLLN